MQEIFKYFDIKKDYHRDIVVHVPLNDFRRLFDNGDELKRRIAKIIQEPDWQQITAELAEERSGGCDEFYIHKAIIVADSINTNGLLAPVHAHWDANNGLRRHPSNDKASIISSGIVRTCNCDELTVPVLWRDCRFHHTLFPDHKYTDWFKDFVVTEIDTPEKYGSMYGEAIYNSELRFEAVTMQYIWDNYPNIWGKLRQLHYAYLKVFDVVRGVEEAENCAYLGLVDKYHRFRMRGNKNKLGDYITVDKDSVKLVTDTVYQQYTLSELDKFK